MPKSQRQRFVPLTNVKKKGRALKEKLVEQIQECYVNYPRVFVFSCVNMRNTKLKELREEWKSSRFFMGKNKVMIFALTNGIDLDEPRNRNLPQLTAHVRGNCGLLFTHESVDTVLKFFADFRETHFARSGFVATQEFNLSKGPLPEVPFSMEPLFRKLGLPTRLDKGIVELLGDVSVCKIGDTLSPEQCKLLEHFNRPMAEFRVLIHCVYENGKLAEYEPHPAPNGELIGAEDNSDAEGDDGDEEEEDAAAPVSAAPAKSAKSAKSHKRTLSTSSAAPAASAAASAPVAEDTPKPRAAKKSKVDAMEEDQPEEDDSAAAAAAPAKKPRSKSKKDAPAKVPSRTSSRRRGKAAAAEGDSDASMFTGGFE